ncbi:unnamed protein product, partial [Bubo scandiacus]
MHCSLSQAVSLVFQRTLASTEAKVSNHWTCLHCLPEPLRHSHPYMPIHTAHTCRLKAEGDAGAATGPQASGKSVSQACLDMAHPSPPYPWQTRCLWWQKGKSWWKRGRREERIETPGRELRRKERRKKGRKERAGGNDGRKREARKGKRVSKHWRGKTKRQKI